MAKKEAKKADGTDNNNSNIEMVHGAPFVLPTDMREVSDLPPLDEWPNRPVFFCVNTASDPSFKVPGRDINAPLPIGIPFDIESDIFKGRILIRIRDIETDDNDGAYFENRRRTWQMVTQGTFKEEIAVADMFQGTEHIRPFQNMPPAVIFKPMEKLLAFFSGHGSINQMSSDKPRIMSCMGSFARVLRADKPGSEPDMKDLNITEDCTAFGGIFTKNKKKISRNQRSKYLSTPKNKCVFDTTSVYTCEYYDHLIDFAKGELDAFGLMRMKQKQSQNGQPTNATSRHRDGRYLASFQIWHEDFVTDESRVNE